MYFGNETSGLNSEDGLKFWVEFIAEHYCIRNPISKGHHLYAQLSCKIAFNQSLLGSPADGHISAVVFGWNTPVVFE